MDEPGSEPGPVDAWVLFLVFGLLIAAHGLYMIVLPSAEPDHWRSTLRIRTSSRTSRTTSGPQGGWR